MAKSYHICKWIYFAILSFPIIEEMASGQQLLRQIVLTYARIIYILVCTRLALPWGLFAIFAHHHYYVDHVPCTFFTVGWHSLVTKNSQTKLMPFLAPAWETCLFVWSRVQSLNSLSQFFVGSFEVIELEVDGSNFTETHLCTIPLIPFWCN